MVAVLPPKVAEHSRVSPFVGSGNAGEIADVTHHDGNNALIGSGEHDIGTSDIRGRQCRQYFAEG